MEEYDPLQWPPNMSLAELHLKCSQPGIDNVGGAECPCCGRFEKLPNSKWPSRDITKDFRNFGGGIPAYFSQLKYFILWIFILNILIVTFHIYLIETVCPKLEGVPGKECTTAFKILKFCDAKILYEELNNTLAQIFSWIQMVTYLLLVFATIGIKIWLQHINHKFIVGQEKIFSKYSFIIKNIPKYYNLQKIKSQIQALNSNAQIIELFYVHGTADLNHAFREYFDLYYKIKHAQSRLAQQQTEQKHLLKLYNRYAELFEVIQQKKHFYTKPSKRVIVVFNTCQERNIIYKKLKINEVRKTIYYTLKVIGISTKSLPYFAESIVQPQQIHWNYIGESSTFKTKVRLQTSFLGLGFMLLCFVLFYFPMIKADEEKVNDPSIGTIVGVIISISVIFLAVIYRMVIVRLMPRRRPSSRMAESYFVVMTTIVFHFFFYLVTPATYFFFIGQIEPNTKLKQFFLAVIIFVGMTLLVAILDIRHLFYNKKKNRLLSDHSASKDYCQQRLHEELNPPSFPIELKLMVICNIWSFNAFYIFQIPYLLFVFLVVLTILFWLDKKNLYKHYKMQSFLSIALQIKIQKIFIILFLLCVSCGFAISTNLLWHRYATVCIFVLAIIVNQTLNYSYKHRKPLTAQKSVTLRKLLADPKVSFRLQDTQRQPFLLQNSQNNSSIGTTQFVYGYHELYQRYLNQFNNERVNEVLTAKAHSIRRSLTVAPKRSQLVGITALQQHLLSPKEPQPTLKTENEPQPIQSQSNPNTMEEKEQSQQEDKQRQISPQEPIEASIAKDGVQQGQ